MFSVSAEPFNSPRRQLYGGWTLDQAGDNIWGKKTYYEMARKYSSDPEEKEKAKQFLHWWKVGSKANPEWRKRLRLAGKNYWKDAIMPPLNDAQKAWIWEYFKATPFNTNAAAQRRSAIVRHAPYPNWQIMNHFDYLGVPYADKDVDIPGGKWPEGSAFVDQLGWRKLKDLEDAFKALKHGYGDPDDMWLANIEQLLPPLKVKKQG